MILVLDQLAKERVENGNVLLRTVSRWVITPILLLPSTSEIASYDDALEERYYGNALG